jgi:GNAT superfamily N-acetyltransferase
MTVRDARPGDNAALVALASQCPMRGHVSLCVDRRPDFFALNRLAGTPWRVGVVDGDNGPIACVAVARRQAHVDGRPTPVAYLGDLKVHPAFRRQGHGRALARWAVTAARDLVGDDGPVLATVLAGNTAVTALPGDIAPGVRRWATVRSHSVALLWRRRLPRTGLLVRPAGPADVPGMTELWCRLASARQFAPVLERFDVETSDLEYLLAHDRDGGLAGFVGLWDQHSIKQMRVTGYSPRLVAARAGVNLVAPLFGTPPLPPPGGTLSYRTVVHPCAPDPATFRTLLLHAYHRLRGRYSLITTGLDTRDPLTRALAGLRAQPTDVHLLVLGGPPPGRAPVHVEIATV